VWKTYRVVIASDGGATFDPEADLGVIWRIKRYATVMGRQASALRKRWLIASYLNKVMTGAYLGIGTPVTRYGSDGPGYPEDVVDDFIAQVRSDLDAFSDAEIAVLQNHGYLIAEAALQTYLRDAPITIATAPLVIPYPDWMDAELVRRSLADSHKTKLPFGRGAWIRYLF